MKENNDVIAKWLDRRYEARVKLMKTLKRTTGQLSMFSYLIPAENRRQNNQAFQTRIQETRRANLPTSSNTVDGDKSSEEPRQLFHPHGQLVMRVQLVFSICKYPHAITVYV